MKILVGLLISIEQHLSIQKSLLIPCMNTLFFYFSISILLLFQLAIMLFN